jgi:hypothetical protein
MIATGSLSEICDFPAALALPARSVEQRLRRRIWPHLLNGVLRLNIAAANQRWRAIFIMATSSSGAAAHTGNNNQTFRH